MARKNKLAQLGKGDRLPRIVAGPPGPVALKWSRRLASSEAPGVNTLPSNFDEALVGEASAVEPPILWREARGANVLDVDGNRYLDLTAGFGVAALGHRNPRVVAAVRRQAGEMIHALGDVHAHPLRVELAERLGHLAPIADPRVHFAISGADAVEIALKTANLATGRAGILAFDPGYHGMTLGALSVSSRDAFRAPFQQRLARGAVRRLPFGCPRSRIDQVLAQGKIGGVIAEPIVGREGVLLPPKGWLAELAESCGRHGALLIADEIFTGFGRTGRWFAVEHEGALPDLLCCGKALGGGLPIAATLGSAKVMEAWRTSGEALHTATHLANPLACAAGLAVLDEMEFKSTPGRAEALGRLVADRLQSWNRRDVVREVRGRGLLWGIEVSHREIAYRWARAALGRGVLALAGGESGSVLQLCPPLTITRRQLTAALDLLEETLPAS